VLRLESGDGRDLLLAHRFARDTRIGLGRSRLVDRRREQRAGPGGHDTAALPLPERARCAGGLLRNPQIDVYGTDAG
jgi:hypothetical protein